MYANEASEQEDGEVEEEEEGRMNDEVGSKLYSVAAAAADLFRFKFPPNTKTPGCCPERVMAF